MPLAGIINHLCECGQILLIVQPEHKDLFKDMIEENEKFSLIVLEGESAPCPKCGKVYRLPAAEELDIERHPFGRWYKKNMPEDTE